MAATIPELDAPEKVLKSLSTFNSLVKQVFSTDLKADLPQDDPQALHSGFLGDLASQSGRTIENVKTAISAFETVRNGGLTDDKKYLVEDVIKLAASLPSDSQVQKMLTTKFIENLWSNLQHPPLTYIGDEWKYRKADGSNNNRMYPQLGAAGSSYARTVEPKAKLPPTLPDAGLIFDELMARGPDVKEHPNKISSMLFYLATIIIHDVFRTNSRDWNRFDNSSYLDLGPLYGNSYEAQAKVRSFKDGLLKPDTFAEVRLLGFPPGVVALICSFNRFHNYIAGELATINEAGRFTQRPKERMTPYQLEHYKTPEALRDHDLFQTARLITCGLYVNIILIDYVRTILNLNQTHSEWILDPRADSDKKYGPSGIPEGVGNQVSVEFNLVYRWHSATSKRDEKWSINFFKSAMPDKDPNTMSLEDLKDAFRHFLEAKGKTDPSKWETEELKRQDNNAFKDDDLVRILSEGTEDVAAAFGARQVPVCMRAIEMLGIEQARSWNVATLNEFRQFFGMIPHQKFTDINSNPDVAQSLETLYGTPDMVELYPGLVTEEAKEPKFPGSGLCPGFTISKAILADAVALVRGDRFYTVDFNASYLTNWGFTQTTSNPQIAGGGVFYKLLHRAFPGWYRGSSIYAMFPLTTPDKTKEILTSLGEAKDYDFSRPLFKPQPIEVSSWGTITSILGNYEKYHVPWGPHTKDMTGHEYMLSGDKPENRQQHAFVHQAMYKPSNGMDEVCKLYEKITMDLIKERSRKLRGGYQLDVVADIANTSHSMAVAQLFHMPIKMPGMTVGPLNPQQFYTIMAVLFAYVFLDLDDGKSFELRMGAKQGAAAIGKIVSAVVALVQANKLHDLWEWVGKATGLSADDPIDQYGVKLIQRFSEGDKSVEEVTWALIPTMAAAVGTQAQGLSQVLNMLLDEEYYHHWAEIRELGKSKDPADFEKLKKYALECLRLQTPAFGLLRNVNEDETIQDGEKTVKVKKGDQLLTNFVKCGKDPEVFPEPEKIKLDRDPKLYIHHGWGSHACIGREIVTNALAVQLKCLSKLKNIRRAPGGQGEMKYKTFLGSFKIYMKADWSDYWPFPTTMKVHYDGVEDW